MLIMLRGRVRVRKGQGKDWVRVNDRVALVVLLAQDWD